MAACQQCKQIILHLKLLDAKQSILINSKQTFIQPNKCMLLSASETFKGSSIVLIQGVTIE